LLLVLTSLLQEQAASIPNHPSNDQHVYLSSDRRTPFPVGDLKITLTSNVALLDIERMMVDCSFLVA
jgi:hypothetical protein